MQKSKALNLFQNNRVNSLLLLFLSLQFKFSVHPYEVCMTIAFPPHLHICLLPVACFELPITRTFFDFPRRFELSGVDCSSKCRIQDGGGFQFLIYAIKNVIMTSLLFLKVINVLATFLIAELHERAKRARVGGAP